MSSASTRASPIPDWFVQRPSSAASFGSVYRGLTYNRSAHDTLRHWAMTLFVSFSPKQKSPAAFKVSVSLLTRAYLRACGLCAALIIPSTEHGTALALMKSVSRCEHSRRCHAEQTEGFLIN